MSISTILWISFGVFGALCTVGLIYGIVTHKMRVAEEEASGERGFLDDMKLPPDWPPITLLISEELEESEARIMLAVTRAATWWEEQTGKRYFVPPGELVDGGHVVSVMLALGSNNDVDHAYAYVYPWVDKNKYLKAASVRLVPGWENVSDETMTNAMKHELGHLLGLAHDNYQGSIMFASVSERTGFVSEKDKKLLENTYDV